MESGTRANRNSNRTLLQIIQLAFCLVLLSSVGGSSSLLTSLARQEAAAAASRIDSGRPPSLSLREPLHKVQIIEDDGDDDGDGDGEYYFDLENELSSDRKSVV